MADFINATIERHEFDTLLEIMKDRAVHLKPIMAVTGNMVVKSVRQNFREGGRPEKWEKSKKSKGMTLIGTGALMKSIHYKVHDDGMGVTIMTGPQKYAAILHFGGTTAPHEIKARNFKALGFMRGGEKVHYRKVHHPGSNIPARPYMLLQDEDIENIKKVMLEYLKDPIK